MQLQLRTILLLYFLIQGIVVFASNEQPLEEVVMYEVVSGSVSTIRHTVPIGSSINEVTFSLSRASVTGILSNVEIRYDSKKFVDVPNSLVECIPHPLIEVAMFFYTSPGGRDELPNDWFNSVVIPFGLSPEKSESMAETSPPGTFLINTYPAIAIEFSGTNRINRIKIQKAEGESKIVLVGDDTECPKDLVEWALN